MVNRTDRQVRRRLLPCALCVVGLCVGTGLLAQYSSPSKGESPAAGQQQEQSATPPRIQLSMKDMKKLFVKRVRPEYPQLAQNARIAGKCRVRIVIGTAGDVRDIRLVFGHPILAPAAIEAGEEVKVSALSCTRPASRGGRGS